MATREEKDILALAGRLAYAVASALRYDKRTDSHTIVVSAVPKMVAELNAYDAAVINFHMKKAKRKR